MTNNWGNATNEDPWGQPPMPEADPWGQPAPDPWGQATPTPMPDPWAQPAPAPRVMRFTKKDLIARHGQGEVWRAELEGSEKQYALKVLLTGPHDGDAESAKRRFGREVRAQSTLTHPGIMPVVSSNFVDSPPWFVMPLAAGSLRDILVSGKTLSEDECTAVILEVAEALSFAHQDGVIHRDVKPENILRFNDRWVLSDFGLCRDFGSDSTTFTKAGGVLGTLPYMSPEQWTDPHNVNASADIFAMGRVFYECLTGKVPWPSVQMDLVPDRFKYIITKCLADQPAGRYVSVEAFMTDLQALTGSQDDLALPIDHAQKLAEDVLAGHPDAVSRLIRFVLTNISDDIFLGGFLPSVTPPVLASIHSHDQSAFTQIVSAFDKVCAGSHPFSWTDSAARFLERVFRVSDDPAVRQMVLGRILRLGTEHNRWAVRDIYVSVISGLTSPQDILMVAGQLSDYPEGATFVRHVADTVSLPPRIVAALAA
ncbi:serine/threonine-protein kinase [Arthrobacter sp. ok362]|uniref:serine/threonine-protein kinase n=1 Tax=Arthrobacter sp. ok362 TaxID=1761745 RepID=UPI000B89BB0D|nr:serine/threonine-protein kinase [Arthrobacter sp. ok362]